MRKLLVLVVLMLSQTACSQGDVSILHIRYNEKMVFPGWYEQAKDACDSVRKYKPSTPEFKVLGDIALYGDAVKDVYWLDGGGYRATYKREFVLRRKGMPECQMRVVPEVTIQYEDFLERKVYGYKRSYIDGLGPDVTHEWGIDDFRKIDGTVDEEVWSVRNMKGIKASQVLGPWAVSNFGSEKVGEERVLDFTCSRYVNKLVNKVGPSSFMCFWEYSSDWPTVLLKGRTEILMGAAVSVEAEKVNIKADVPSSMLIPPAEWKGKPSGHYKKTPETKGRWLNEEKMKALNKAKSKQ